MGERTSVRMLKAALGARDVDAEFVEPGMDEWPVITDEHGEVDVEESRRRARQLATDMAAKGYVPVVSGFVAEDRAGNVTTLGRGGSDTSALMLGNHMDADEVVIITDVEGVMTGDPGVVEGARNVGEITVDELRNLSFRGAEVVAPSALTYKGADMDVRVAHYQHGDLMEGGTSIEGQFDNLIDLRETPLACLTVAGRAIRNTPGILSDLSAALSDADVNVDAVSSGMDSVTFYLDEEVAERAEKILHEAVIDAEPLSSVTVDDDVAVIRVTGGQLPDESGVLQDVIVPLAEEHITVHDLITSATSVSVFVGWADRERALEIIQNAV
jgi:aspartate kinase